MASYLYRLGRFAFRRRRIVIVVWLVVLAAAITGAATLSGPTSNAFRIPGTPSQRAIDVLAQHRETDGRTSDRAAGSDLESKPATEVSGHGTTKIRFSHPASDVAVDVDIQAGTHTQIAGKQRCRALDDPPDADQVQPVEQSVVRDLSLQLRKRPWSRR